VNDFYAAALAEGFARPGARHISETLDVVGGPLAIVPDDDVERGRQRDLGLLDEVADLVR
jgi:hypothetical protein